ncbi:YqgQ family protein [Salipaludibacillus daqingensis]|uniref:YqgQ family protein n=1 Tax=Salipaludibacillus daqingensis TaxID=3041001 RepID=UPI00247624DA|nr:YqgQ family protein [Salipaludibacillus daqingensis]
MTYFELIQFLKTYQTFIYTGNREADLDLIEEEIQELYSLGMIDPIFFRDAKLTIRRERRKS